MEFFQVTLICIAADPFTEIRRGINIFFCIFLAMLFSLADEPSKVLYVFKSAYTFVKII